MQYLGSLCFDGTVLIHLFFCLHLTELYICIIEMINTNRDRLWDVKNFALILFLFFTFPLILWVAFIIT